MLTMNARAPRSRISLEAMEPIGRLNRPLRELRRAFVFSLLAGVFLPLVTVAAQKHAKPQHSHAGRVQMGLDVLESEKFASLRGKHVGLITNHTGVDFQGRS